MKFLSGNYDLSRTCTGPLAAGVVAISSSTSQPLTIETADDRVQAYKIQVDATTLSRRWTTSIFRSLILLLNVKIVTLARATPARCKFSGSRRSRSQVRFPAKESNLLDRSKLTALLGSPP